MALIDLPELLGKKLDRSEHPLDNVVCPTDPYPLAARVNASKSVATRITRTRRNTRAIFAFCSTLDYILASFCTTV